MQQWHGWCRYNGSKNSCLQTRGKRKNYMRMFFYLIDIVLVNSHVIYRNLVIDILLLNFKIVSAEALIGRYSNRKKLFPTCRPSKQRSHEPFMPREVPTHILQLQEKQMRRYYCKNEGSRSEKFRVLSDMLPVLMLDKSVKLLFEESFVVFQHDDIAYYIRF